MSANELTHHGIKGQRWGVRRYQNADGTLTPAGKRRLQKEEKMSDDAKTASELKKKKVSEMSNAELRKLNERKQLENQYAQLNPSNFKKGVAIVAGATAVMGTALSLYNTTNNTVKMGKSVGNSILDKVGNMVVKDLNKGLSKGF